MQDDVIKAFMAACGGAVTWLFGAWDTPIIVLLCFLALDYLTGILKGYINKEISSHKGMRGIIKKALIFIVLIVAVMLDKLINNGMPMFRSMIAYFYIVNEGISILENSSEIGLPVPQALKDALIQLKKENKNASNKT